MTERLIFQCGCSIDVWHDDTVTLGDVCPKHLKQVEKMGVVG